MTAERKFNALFISAEPQQQREADNGNDRGRQYGVKQDHLSSSIVTGA